MRTLSGTLVVAAMAVGGSALSAHADSTITCPLFQATGTIINTLPAGWSATPQVNNVTDYKVDSSSGQQVLVCVYGASGRVQRPAPVNNNCSKISNRRFKCVSAPPPPPPGPLAVSDGPLSISDGGTADLDAGGQADLRLNVDNPFLRLLEPINGTQLSPQGTHKPTVDECVSAPYSSNPILQTQLPVGVWVCATTSDGNVGRFRIASINGIPGLPLPMTIFLDHTTWSPGGGGGGGGGGVPPVHSTGLLPVPQTYNFDLDEGQVGSGPGVDIWFQAVNPVQMYLKPMNGAQLAVGNKQNRGYSGCSVAAFSPNAVPLNTLPVGSYICAATNEGRVSQFRINGISPGSPKTLTLGYTTWE